MLRVESTVCFQRKRGLPAALLTQAGQVSVVVHCEFGCVLRALTTCLSAAQGARKQLRAPSLLRVESTVYFQRKRGLPAALLTQAGQVSVVVL